MPDLIPRRIFLGAVTGLALLRAQRSDAIVKKLQPTDPEAKAIGYFDDAAQVPADEFPSFRKGQSCANCALVQMRYGPMRPCKLLPGKVVSAKGWCSAWALRVFKK